MPNTGHRFCFSIAKTCHKQTTFIQVLDPFRTYMLVV
jgi:hypothetical protein